MNEILKKIIRKQSQEFKVSDTLILNILQKVIEGPDDNSSSARNSNRRDIRKDIAAELEKDEIQEE